MMITAHCAAGIPGLFVKFGLLNAENRIPFSKADTEILTSIDIEEEGMRFPFFDRETGTTLYGIDTLLGNYWPEIVLCQIHWKFQAGKMVSSKIIQAHLI